MSQVNLRNPEDVRRALLPWLHDRLPEADEILLSDLSVPEIGGSSETFLLCATIIENGRERQERWVLRIEATGYQVYRDPSVERQFRVMEVLSQIGDVPVPTPLWYEQNTTTLGAPFFVMQRVEGQTIPSYHHTQGLLAEATPRNRELMWLSAIEAMAKIHCTPVEKFAFLARPELGATGLEQEIAYWAEYMTWTGAPVRPEQERGLLWLTDNRPADSLTGLAWGDARPGNIIFLNNKCQAVIDWETASLGGAETDLGWWLFCDWSASEGQGVARLEGTGDKASTISNWQHFAGRKAMAIEWHEAFATWRFSLIVDRARFLFIRNNQPDALPAEVGANIANRLAKLIAA